MFFDMQEVTLEGMVSFPDFPFSDLQLQPDMVKETVLIQGTVPGGRNLSITGTADAGGNAY